MKKNNSFLPTIVIAGAGFGGVRTAQVLAKKMQQGEIPPTRIILINPTPHFEYHAAWYRVVTGSSPFEVCIPLSTLFEQYLDVEVVEDAVLAVDPENKTVEGVSGSEYHYDFLVLALGSVPEDFNTPGVNEFTYHLSSTSDTLKLKRMVHEMMQACIIGTQNENLCKTHFVIVGGGPTGVEMAGALSIYARQVAAKHGIDPSYITVDLIQSSSHLLKQAHPEVSKQAELRLRHLGVNLFFNRRVLQRDLASMKLADMTIESTIVIWTAGVKAHPLLELIPGLKMGQKDRVAVSSQLQAKGVKDIFVIGDCADTPRSGMAQTALYDAEFVGEVLDVRLNHHAFDRIYTAPSPILAVPIGDGWATVEWGNLRVHSFLGWMVRRWLDWKVFRTLLPFSKALAVFREGGKLSETCRVCG